MIDNMVQDKKDGWMEIIIKECIMMVKNMVKEF